jgi:hypothetical protein
MAMEKRRIGRISRTFGLFARFSTALLLVIQVVYTPIHIMRVPHSDEADIIATSPLAIAAAYLVDEDQDGDGHHERHAASQHKLKVLRSERLVMGQIFVASAVPFVDAAQNYPKPPMVEFSGLSPPEFTHCWQFIFRAALPVRAPSIPS